MSAINTQTLIHVGVELVVVAGITFWLNKKISDANIKSAQQADQISQLKAALEQQNQLLMRHEAIFQQMFGSEQGPPENTQMQPHVSPPQSQSQSQIPPSQEIPPPQSQPQPQVPPSQSKFQGQPVSPAPIGDVLGTDLDAMMEEEMDAIQGSGDTEVNCNGDTCTLKLEKRKDKKHRKRGSKKSHRV